MEKRFDKAVEQVTLLNNISAELFMHVKELSEQVDLLKAVSTPSVIAVGRAIN